MEEKKLGVEEKTLDVVEEKKHEQDNEKQQQIKLEVMDRDEPLLPREDGDKIETHQFTWRSCIIGSLLGCFVGTCVLHHAGVQRYTHMRLTQGPLTHHLAILFYSFIAASNTYLGLKVGFTFGAGIFGAIFSFAIIRPLSTRLPEALGGGYFGPKENVTAQSAATTAGMC